MTESKTETRLIQHGEAIAVVQTKIISIEKKVDEIHRDLKDFICSADEKYVARDQFEKYEKLVWSTLVGSVFIIIALVLKSIGVMI